MLPQKASPAQTYAAAELWDKAIAAVKDDPKTSFNVRMDEAEVIRLAEGDRKAVVQEWRRVAEGRDVPNRSGALQ